MQSQELAVDGLMKRCRESGAVGLQIINPQSVTVGAWVPLKCQYGCRHYGTSNCCPPRSPTPGQMREILDGYGRAVLVHFKSRIEAQKTVVRLEREAFQHGFFRAVALGTGPCMLCKECDLTECRYPATARPSMEACGIDVFATARAQGFSIEVVEDRTGSPDYFALLLLD